MKHLLTLLALLLALTGCALEPTNTRDWEIAFSVEAGALLDPGSVLRECETLVDRLGLPLVFSLAGGSKTVYVDVLSFTPERSGWCRTGDDCRTWIITSFQITDPSLMAAIIVHEIGHSYGLGHSTIPGNLMFETVGPNPTIAQWQVNWIIALTGS